MIKMRRYYQQLLVSGNGDFLSFLHKKRFLYLFLWFLNVYGLLNIIYLFRFTELITGSYLPTIS